MTRYVNSSNIKVAQPLYDFLIRDVLPDSGLDAEKFFGGLADIIAEFAPQNQALLQKRAELQRKIDAWHRRRRGRPHDQEAYVKFLEKIGYIEEEIPDFKIETRNLDPEIATMAGPQLVAPVANDRYATNAANARWMSLSGAVYASDMIADEGETTKGESYNSKRGAEVIKFTDNFLDETFPLTSGVSHSDVKAYSVGTGPDGRNRLVALLENDEHVELQQPEKFAGHQGEVLGPSVILLKNNGLHVEISIDRNDRAGIGKAHPAGVADIKVEAALTTIMDLEDSIAAVNAGDKVEAYRNWLALMKGTLISEFLRNGKPDKRGLNPATREYTGAENGDLELSNRSLMLIRNVGLFMPPNDSVRGKDGKTVQEGILDAVITALIARHNLIGNGDALNSKHGSIYVVMPKMHGSAEVAYACALFARVEDLLGLERNTIKMGIMDEERRTSVNLKNCIAAAKDRVFFINTGFLDRTGDEYRTSTEAGLLAPKTEMRDAEWFNPYENRNVRVGIGAGFSEVAQIGKGMWPEPANMTGMYAQKSGHSKAGATTAWVPSPSAAAIHALHYHQTNVISQVHPTLLNNPNAANDNEADRRKLLVVPFAKKDISDEERIKQLDNNIQGILGYSARWIKFGIGCSSVKDVNGVDKMEDCATVRISVGNVNNWLLRGRYTREEIETSIARMAVVVDRQNLEQGDDFTKANYRAMSGNLAKDNAIAAARELVLRGKRLPNGYVQGVLYKYRKKEIAEFGERADPPWRRLLPQLAA